MPIDFSRAQTPNFLEIYQASFERGRAAGRTRAIEAALARRTTDPQGALRELQGLDPAMAGSLQRQDLNDARGILSLKGEQREQAIRNAEVLSQLLQGLARTPDVQQRRAMALHLAQQIPQFGLGPEDVAAFDFSDAGIAREIQALAPLVQGARRAPSRPGQGLAAGAGAALSLPDPFSGE
jgi:hypothetical protein